MNFQDLPLLILNHVIRYLDSRDLTSLSISSKFLQDLVLQHIHPQYHLPLSLTEEENISKKDRRKFVITLNIAPQLSGDLETKVIAFETIDRQVKLLNLEKLFELNLVFNGEEHSSIFCGSMFLQNVFKETEVNLKKLKVLKIQMEFTCLSCRELLNSLSSCDKLENMKYLQINMGPFKETITVGLCVYSFKLMFRITSLDFLEISKIPNSMLEELKLWFLPDIVYFSRLRPFELLENSLTRDDSIMIKFIEN